MPITRWFVAIRNGRPAPTVGMLVASLAVSCPLGAQGAGSVRGTVFDSTAMEPLPGAAVVLWETPFRTATDSAGRFELTGVTPGTYDVLFYHRTLGQMGISTGPRRVTVPADGAIEIELATPSVFTLVASECFMEESVPGTGIVAGWVGDGESGMGLPGARVTLSWAPPGQAQPSRRTLLSDPAGWYRDCAVPADVPISAGARFLDRQGLMREFTVEAGGLHDEGFLLDRYETSDVSGTLVDAVAGEAVAGAKVWLRGTSFRTVSTGRGAFAFEAVPAGRYMLVTDHLGYGTRMDTLEVPSGRTLSVEMRLDTRPIEIAPLTVTVEAEPSITERAMGGHVIDRAAIEAVSARARDVGDVVRSQNVRGVVVRRSGESVCIGYGPGQVRMMFRNDCVPMIVFIDNVRATNQDLAVQIAPEAVDRIILYRPVEAGNLFGLGAGNGVIAIFTRGAAR